MMERMDYVGESEMAMQQAPAAYQADPSDAYAGAQDMAQNNAVLPQPDIYEIEDEHIRYLNETRKFEKNKTRASNAQRKYELENDELTGKNSIKIATEKGAEVVATRMDYDAGIGSSDLAIELLKFTEHSAAQKKEYKEYKRRSAKIRKSVKKAVKLERQATKRYYEVLAKEANSLTILRKSKKQEELSIVLTRLENLLRDREIIDERLAALYKGATTEKGGKIRIRAEKKKLKKAKQVHRSLRAANRRLESYDVPDTLKTKIRFLFNTKIVTASTVAYSNYLLKKLNPRGDARSELKSNIKTANQSLNRLEESLKRMMKKAERYHKSRKRGKAFLGAFLFLVLAAAVACIIIMGLGK